MDLELPVGCHQYMFRVDGEWRLDPSNTLVSLYSVGHDSLAVPSQHWYTKKSWSGSARLRP